MKTTISKVALATSLALALSATSNAVTVYKTDDSNLDIIGRMKINLNNNDADDDRRLSGTARLGVRGKTKVNDAFGVFAQVFYDLKAQETKANEDVIKIREAWVGADFHEFGKITLGRYRDAFYQTTSITDLFIDWGDQGVTYWGVSKNDYGGRRDGQIKYDVNVNGFSLSASYQFKQANKYINYNVGATVGYEYELPNDAPIGIYAGYNHYDGLKSEEDSGYHANGLYYGADKNEAAVGLYYGSFGVPGFYAAAVYNYGKLEYTYKTHGVEAALSYTTPDAGWTFSAVYQYAHNSDDKLTKNDLSVLNSAWTGEIIYNLTSNFQIYTDLEYRHEAVFRDESEKLATLGLIYNF